MPPEAAAQPPAENPAYTALETRFRRLNALREAAGVLHWDMSTLMPRGGAEARAEQLAALQVTCHELLTGAETAEHFGARCAASGATPRRSRPGWWRRWPRRPCAAR
jgi:Zn-dependent M32 family carboxypeptidase